jgi:hypothetical protein
VPSWQIANQNLTNQNNHKTMNLQTTLICCSLFVSSIVMGQQTPKILTDSKTNYLPDFSYAGYHFGESQIPVSDGQINSGDSLLNAGLIKDQQKFHNSDIHFL